MAQPVLIPRRVARLPKFPPPPLPIISKLSQRGVTSANRTNQHRLTPEVSAPRQMEGGLHDHA